MFIAREDFRILTCAHPYFLLALDSSRHWAAASLEIPISNKDSYVIYRKRFGAYARRVLLRFWAIFSTATLFVAVSSASKLPVRTLGFDQGLPRNTASCLRSGPEGFLWVCTSEGLVRFDGYHVRVFGEQQGLSSALVFDFLPASSGGYWLITEQGVCRIPPRSEIGKRCQRIDWQLKPGEFEYGRIVESPSSGLWVLASGWLFHMVKSQTQLSLITSGVPCAALDGSLSAGPDGTVLVSSECGLYQYWADGRFRNLTASLGRINFTSGVGQAYGLNWIGSKEGLYYFSLAPNCPAVTFHRAFTGSIWIYSLLTRNDGSLWIAGASGLARVALNNKGVPFEAERYGRNEGLPNDEVDYITEDANGDLCGATLGAGIFRVQKDGFRTYFDGDGLGSARIASIFEDRAGRLCVMTSWNGENLHVRDGAIFKRININYPPEWREYGWGWNQFGLQDHRGDWWIPTGAGVLRFRSLGATERLRTAKPFIYGSNSPIGASDVFRTFEDSSHNIWISCFRPQPGLFRWNRANGTFRRWTAADGFPDKLIVTSMREYAPGVLWLSTQGPLLRFQDERFEAFSLPLHVSALETRDLYVDTRGRLWLASHRGLFRCDDPSASAPHFVRYGVGQGLSSEVTRSVTEDNYGRIYVGTVRGIDQFTPGKYPELGRVRHFTRADGLPDAEQNVSFRDHNGHLWFGTLRGLAEYDPAIRSSSSPPRVYLSRVRVRGREIALSWEGSSFVSLHLRNDQNQLEIEYAAINLPSNASTQYQYRFGDSNALWSPATDELNVTYASLPWGESKFEVRAVDGYGRPSKPATVSVVLDIPIWYRWWFILCCVLTLELIVFALYKFRVHHLLAVERVRLGLASDLHDDVGASLSQISILSELARGESSSRLLDDIAEVSRAAVSDMNDIIWAVNPLHDPLEELIHRMRRFASDTLGAAQIEMNFHVGVASDLRVPLQIRRPLFLVFKEIVNNAAKHSRASRVEISLNMWGKSLQLSVMDDGVGFSSTSVNTGEGLASIRRRLSALGGTATWNSTQGKGTQIVTTFPLRKLTLFESLRRALRRKHE